MVIPIVYFFLNHRKIFMDFNCLQNVKIMYYSLLQLKIFHIYSKMVGRSKNENKLGRIMCNSHKVSCCIKELS